MAYANGRIPKSALKKSVIGVYLDAAAANSADRLAVKFEKRFGKPLRATDGYRALTGDRYAQHEIFLDRYVPYYVQFAPGRTDARKYNGVWYYRKPGYAAAAVPGTSNHGTGNAVDFASGINTSFSSAENLWMQANAPEHGFSLAEGRSVNEPWHWTYDKKADKVRKRLLAARKAKRLPIIPTFNKAVREEWQRQLGGLKVDGVFGSGSATRLRARLNAKNGRGGYKLANGPLKGTGPLEKRDIQAVQKLLNLWSKKKKMSLSKPLKVTGKMDGRTKMALRKSLNEGLWK